MDDKKIRIEKVPPEERITAVSDAESPTLQRERS